MKKVTMGHLTKRLYQTNLNWHGDTYKFYAWAVSEAQAKTFFCKKLALKLGVSLGSIISYFNKGTDNIKITEEGAPPWKP